MSYFDPQKMAVYRLAREHNRTIHALLKGAHTKGFSDLVSQLRRAATSIAANLLEAFGDYRAGVRLHYLQIAKASTWECWAHCDSMVDYELVKDPAVERFASSKPKA